MKYVVFIICSFWAMLCFAEGENIIPIDNFISASKYKGVALSPNEENYFRVSLLDDQYLIEVFSNPFSEQTIQQEYIIPTSRLSGIAWISNDEIVISSTIVEKNTRGRKKGFLREWRLLNVSDKKNNKFLSYPVNLMVANQPASLVHILPDDDEHILISYPDKKGIYPSVFKVNVNSGKQEKIIAAQKPINNWLVNSKGQILMGYGSVDGKTKLLVRNTNSGELLDISDGPLFKTGYFTPLEQGLSGDKLFVSSAIGHGRKKIYHYDYNTNTIISKVFEHPKVDVEDILYSRKKEKVIAATYIDDRFEYEFFDEEFEAIYKQVANYFPDKKVSIVQENEDGEFLIISAENANKPRDFFIYSKKEKSIKPIVEGSTQLNSYKMADVSPVTYFSRDGLEIHAYLTIPNNSEGPFPTIIMPHGGPWARDVLGYNDWAQFLANRGYAVLQPNFRGSTGYGNTFTNISMGEWGGKMQDDLTDGLKWLEKKGIAEIGNACIVGASYGGYAALMGAINDPYLYRCAVSIAPVTDLNNYINTYKNFPDRDRLMQMVVGDNSKKFLSNRSPRKLAKNIQIPILLVHGNSDIRVDIKHSYLMEKSLKRAKKDFEFIELDGASHFLLQDEHKRILLEKMEVFLENNLMKNFPNLPTS